MRLKTLNLNLRLRVEVAGVDKSCDWGRFRLRLSGRLSCDPGVGKEFDISLIFPVIGLHCHTDAVYLTT